MRFRTRLFLALALAGVIPLVFLALGVRREVDRRLSAEYRARVDGAVRSIRADLTRESTAIQGRLGAFAAQLAADDRFRRAVVENDPASRTWVLDWGRFAIRQSGLAVLQLQDSSGRILSSGHFRQEYDRVRPDLPAFLARSGGWPALAEARTPEGPVLALVRSDSFTVAGRRFTLVGGVATEGRFLGPLPGDSGFAVRLVRATRACRRRRAPWPPICRFPSCPFLRAADLCPPGRQSVRGDAGGAPPGRGPLVRGGPDRDRPRHRRRRGVALRPHQSTAHRSRRADRRHRPGPARARLRHRSDRRDRRPLAPARCDDGAAPNRCVPAPGGRAAGRRWATSPGR